MRRIALPAALCFAITLTVSSTSMASAPAGTPLNISPVQVGQPVHIHGMSISVPPKQMTICGSAAGPGIMRSACVSNTGTRVLDVAPQQLTHTHEQSTHESRVEWNECRDTTYQTFGAWRSKTVRIRLNRSGVPRRLTNIDSTIREAASTLTRAKNDCGRADKVNVRLRYAGSTHAASLVKEGRRNREATCTGQADGQNTISFGRDMWTSEEQILGVTCFYLLNARSARNGTPQLAEADVMFNQLANWQDQDLGDCSNRNSFALSNTAVHEFGHVLGLAHPSEDPSKHPSLTMGYGSVDYCDTYGLTLGSGDLNGLESLY